MKIEPLVLIKFRIPKEYDSSTQSETTGDLKAIVVMQAGPRSDALAVLVLDMLSSRAIMLKSKHLSEEDGEIFTLTLVSVRDDFPYVTIPSRHDTHTATILVKEIDFSAPKLPQLKAAPDSNAVALLESNATRKIRLCFKDSKGQRTL
jgi:hypothetical protein